MAETSYRLLVAGVCARPMALSWDELDALARDAGLVADTSLLSGKVRGEGVRLAALLARAAPLETATHVMVHDDGAYRACLSLDEARAAAVLAHRLDGAPLTEALGGPVRLLVPTSDNACLSVKRVAKIELLVGSDVDTVPRGAVQLRRG